MSRILLFRRRFLEHMNQYHDEDYKSHKYQADLKKRLAHSIVAVGAAAAFAGVATAVCAHSAHSVCVIAHFDGEPGIAFSARGGGRNSFSQLPCQTFIRLLRCLLLRLKVRIERDVRLLLSKCLLVMRVLPPLIAELLGLPQGLLKGLLLNQSLAMRHGGVEMAVVKM
jgi:hypothetical protein